MSVPSAASGQRPRPVAFVVWLIAAWLMLGLLAFWIRRGPIETDLARRATEAVEATGATGVQVEADGRDLVLHGRFDSEQQADEALAAAAEVSGAGSVRLADDVVIASVSAQPLVVAVDAAGLSVSAVVPDNETRARLLGAAADAHGGAVSGNIAVDPAVAMPAVEVVDELVGVLTSVPGERSARLEGTSVVLTGTAPDEATRTGLGDRALAAVRAALPDATLDNRLSVVPAAADAPGGASAAAADPTTSGSAASGGAAGGDPASAAEARGALEEALAGASLTFEAGTSRLGEEVRSRLDKVAQALTSGPLTVVIAGHTDSTGQPDFNRWLSLERARSVAAYLVERGVPQERLRTVGHGSDRPVADNSTEAGRAANRRVEITPATG